MSTEHSKKEFRMNAVGNYKFQGITLGRGNFATVVLATHRVIGAGVALKIINTAADVEDYVIENLEREAKILARLNHPNIVKLYETAMCNRLYCLALECVMGGDLGEHVRKEEEKRLSEADARILFHQMISAVGHMHRNGILHRDLKLENILMVNPHLLKLADFGLSNFYNLKEPLKTRCGSPEYAAPELFQSDVTYGPAVDMWSAGVILYVMVVGTVPFVYPKKNVCTVEARRKLLHEKCSKGLVDEHFEAMKHISKECRSLIKGLLEPNQKLRLKLKDVEKHQWMKDGFFLKQVEKDLPSPGSEEDLHRTILTRLSIRTGIPEKEFEYGVQNFRFGKYYAMYHLMRDSMIKSGAPYKSLHSIHVLPQKQNENLRQNLKKEEEEAKVKTKTLVKTNRVESSVKPTAPCNPTTVNVPSTRNERAESCRPSSKLAAQDCAKKPNETTGTTAATENKKGKQSVTAAKQKLDPLGLGLPSHSRNVLLKSICENQKKNDEERDSKRVSKLQRNSKNQDSFSSSRGYSKENAVRESSWRTDQGPAKCNTPQTVKVGSETSNSRIKSSAPPKCESKGALNNKTTNVTPKSSVSKTKKNSKGTTVISPCEEHPDSRGNIPLSTKNEKKQPQSSKIVPNATTKHTSAKQPITILKRPTTAMKHPVKPPCTPTNKSLAENHFTILKKPAFKSPIKQRARTPYTSAVPAVQTMRESTWMKNPETCTVYEGSAAFTGEPTASEAGVPLKKQSGVQNPQKQRECNAESDEIKSICPRCHKDRNSDSKRTSLAPYPHDQQHLSWAQRKFDKSPVIKMNNHGKNRETNAPFGDAPLKRMVNASTTTTDDSSRIQFPSNATNNRAYQYNTHSYKPFCTQGMCNIRGHVPDSRQGIQPVYSATYYRSGSNKQPGNVVQPRMAYSRPAKETSRVTPGSSFPNNGENVAYSVRQCHGDEHVTFDTAQEHPCRGDGIEVKCYSCDTKFSSHGSRRIPSGHGDRPIIRNAFGAQWA